MMLTVSLENKIYSPWNNRTRTLVSHNLNQTQWTKRLFLFSKPDNQILDTRMAHNFFSVLGFPQPTFEKCQYFTAFRCTYLQCSTSSASRRQWPLDTNLSLAPFQSINPINCYQSRVAVLISWRLYVHYWATFSPYPAEKIETNAFHIFLGWHLEGRCCRPLPS